MYKTAVLKHFGGQQATADALGITKSAVSQWGELIPKGSAAYAEVVSRGQLKLDPTLYPPKKFKPAELSA